MSMEDAPGPTKSVSQSGTISISCAAGCGATDRVPAFEDRVAKKLRPVQVTPWVCNTCWLASWRPVMNDDGRWKARHGDGREIEL